MKKLMLICAPVTSRSGYGDHARDLVRSFLKHEKYDIKIQDVRWGDCPRNALSENNSEDKKILDCILTIPNLDRQPDVYVDIRIPNEFQQIGKYNIGITAGVETTAVSGNWIENCNKMDLIIVPSKHSQGGFIQSIYDKVENLPDGSQRKIGELKLEKPIEVLFEGVDSKIYKSINEDEIDSDFKNFIDNKVSEDYAFLFIGQWTSGGYGEDRKDIAKLVKIFYESFANKKEKPALILKTNGATFSVIDKEDILTKLNYVKSLFPSDWELPNVYLFHGSLSTKEINELYNHPKIKSFVSITHGEGFGRPLLEATMTGLPVIASNWSGHLDFLNETDAMMLPGKLEQVPKSQVWENIIIPESSWFNVDEDVLYKALNYAYQNKKEFKKKAKQMMYANRNKFTLDKMTLKLDEIMEKYVKDSPQQVGLKLPKLKKVESPKLELPKLKKVTEEK